MPNRRSPYRSLNPSATTAGSHQLPRRGHPFRAGSRNGTGWLEPAQPARSACREQLRPDNPHILRVAHLLVCVLVDVGPYSQARQLSEDTLTRARRVFGEDHPRTRKAAGNLAAALRLLSGDSDPADES
ncbi:MAG: tetratricopeptide repeat protein [Pseudonocardiaceae bacterium]